MINFQEFISLRENIKINPRKRYEDHLSYLDKVLSHLKKNEVVKITFNFVKLVRQFLSPESIKGLDLVEKWIGDNESVKPEEFLDAYSNIDAISLPQGQWQSPTSYANKAVGYLLNSFSIFGLRSQPTLSQYAAKAINSVSMAMADNRLERIRILERFIQLTHSLTTDKKHGTVPSNQWLDKSDKDHLTLAVWLDSLEEDGKQEVIDQIKRLVQRYEGSYARDNPQLAELITKSDYKDQYLHYIQNIFQGVK